MFLPAALAWEAFWKVTLLAPQVATGKQGFNGEELDVSQGCYQVYPWRSSTASWWQSQGERVWCLHW